jgi:hypothetical protein
MDYKSKEKMDASDLFHVVVARYKESVDWLAPFAPHIRLYNKGPSSIPHPFITVNLPNIGRESHTYLQYILDYYDRLPQIVVFTQGDITEELAEQYPNGKLSSSFIIELVRSAYEHGQSQNFFLNERIPPPWRATPALRMSSYKGNQLESAGMTLGEWYESRIGRPYPASPPWYIHALFAVKRERILQHPRSLYERLIADLTTADPEVGHFFEKTWLLLFSAPAAPT